MSWDTFALAGVALLSGSPSLMATAVAAAAASQGKQGGASSQPSASSPGAAAPGACCRAGADPCCRFVIEGPFLLETSTGRVWRFDQTKEEFLIVKREVSPFEKSWQQIVAAKLAAHALDALNDATKASSQAEHARVSPLVDAHIRSMDAYVAQLGR